MSDFVLKENQCTIFKNDKKGNEKAPDYSGIINIAGTEKKIALWVKEGTKGKFFSGNISEKYVKKEGEVKTEKPKPEESDLPF